MPFELGVRRLVAHAPSGTNPRIPRVAGLSCSAVGQLRCLGVVVFQGAVVDRVVVGDR